jgi:hypothetical protein
MLRFYIKSSVFLILTFATFIAVISWFDPFQPIHPALRGFVEGCEGIPQPCWYGIVPGVTPLGEAQNKLEILGYQGDDNIGFPEIYSHTDRVNDCWDRLRMFSFGESYGIIALEGYRCSDLRLGHAMAILGNPTHILTVCQIFIGFQQAKINILTRNSDFETPILPYSEIRDIQLFSATLPGNTEYQYGPIVDRWHGFMTDYQYLRFEPGAEPVPNVCG